MKKHGKSLLTGLFCTVFLLFWHLGCIGMEVQAAEITPRYANTSAITSNLQFKNNNANCVVTVIGKSGTSKITGTITLYDNTDKKTIASWKVDYHGSTYMGNKSAKVKAQHEYALSFKGKVYNSNSVGESISVSKTKKN